MPAIVLLGLVGCGGGDGTSKSDFIAEADRTCKDMAAQGRALAPAVEEAQTAAGRRQQRRREPNAIAYPRQVTALASVAGRLATERVRRFKALDLPSDDARPAGRLGVRRGVGARAP